jgi:hypothetical protein
MNKNLKKNLKNILMGEVEMKWKKNFFFKFEDNMLIKVFHFLFFFLNINIIKKKV